MYLGTKFGSHSRFVIRFLLVGNFGFPHQKYPIFVEQYTKLGVSSVYPICHSFISFCHPSLYTLVFLEFDRCWSLLKMYHWIQSHLSSVLLNNISSSSNDSQIVKSSLWDGTTIFPTPDAMKVRVAVTDIPVPGTDGLEQEIITENGAGCQSKKLSQGN